MRLLHIEEGSGNSCFPRVLSMHRNSANRIKESRNYLKMARSSSVKVDELVNMLVQKVGALGCQLIISTAYDEEISACGKVGKSPKLSDAQESYLFKGTPVYVQGHYMQPLKVERHVIGYLSVSFAESDYTLLAKELVGAYASIIAQELLLINEKSSLEMFSDKFLQKKDELERVQRYNSKLLSMTTHDLSSPLNAVSGYLDLVDDCLRKNVSKNKIINYQRRIRSGIEDISGMLEQLSEIARLERGKESLEYVNVNLYWTVQQVADLMKGNAQAKNISLAVSGDDMPVFVNVDCIKLKRIIYNLVSNAIKYTREGGTIRVTIESDNSKALLKVKDNGIGISDSELSSIFEPFVKLKKAEKDLASCGLGLYISSYFAELMDGQILVESKVNSGSTFTLELPAVEVMERQNWQAG